MSPLSPTAGARGLRAPAPIIDHHPGKGVIRLSDQQPVIATENLIVHDDNIGIDRQIVAGVAVPPDLVEAYRNAVGDETAAADLGQVARDDLDAKSVEELKDQADARGLTVQGTGKDGNVLKADLVKALKA